MITRRSSLLLVAAALGAGAAAQQLHLGRAILGGTASTKATPMPRPAKSLTILVVGATGSIGRKVVEEALSMGHRVRAMVRGAPPRGFPEAAELVTADLTRPETLPAAVAGVDAIIFTHGTYGNPVAAEAVDYGGVRNVLAALGARRPRITLMSTVGATDRKGSHDWKRRGERLVRASGAAYTIVRPGWFDYNLPGEQRLVFRQGDTRQSGTPRDGAISRSQLAQVLVASLSSPAAAGKTLELSAEQGAAQADIEPLFAALDGDGPGALDGARDAANMPLESEPAAIRAALAAVK